ncbi:17754_t:CDS:2, partial [Funneliformis geosporum]
SGIAGLQLQAKEIWVRYNDECVSIKQNSLEDLAVSYVDDLKGIIKNHSSSDEEEEDVSHVEPNRIEEAFQVEYQVTTLETFYSRLKQFHDEWYKQIKPHSYADAVKECFPSSPLTCLQKVPLKSFLKSLLCEKIDGLD